MASQPSSKTGRMSGTATLNPSAVASAGKPEATGAATQTPAANAASPTGDTPKPKRVNRDPFTPFQTEIMQNVIKPKIKELIASHPGLDDTLLHSEFKKQTGSCVALNRFRDWMKACGFVQAWVADQ